MAKSRALTSCQNCLQASQETEFPPTARTVRPAGFSSRLSARSRPASGNWCRLFFAQDHALTTSIICIAILVAVPSFVAGWLVGGFRELRLARGRR